MIKYTVILIFALLSCASGVAQGKAVTFDEAKRLRISSVHLDSLYKSAVHSDPNRAVFKTEKDQARLQKAYQDFIRELAVFLNANHFKWGKTTRCFNRIYFAPDGTIEHFLYNFPSGEISDEQQTQFARLIEIFAQQHKIGITASEKFAQCSPIRYNDL